MSHVKSECVWNILHSWKLKQFRRQQSCVEAFHVSWIVLDLIVGGAFATPTEHLKQVSNNAIKVIQRI